MKTSLSRRSDVNRSRRWDWMKLWVLLQRSLAADGVVTQRTCTQFFWAQDKQWRTTISRCAALKSSRGRDSADHLVTAGWKRLRLVEGVRRLHRGCGQKNLVLVMLWTASTRLDSSGPAGLLKTSSSHMKGWLVVTIPQLSFSKVARHSSIGFTFFSTIDARCQNIMPPRCLSRPSILHRFSDISE